MEWQREGLLSAVEFQKAKDKILGEEPSLSCMACLPASLQTVYGIPDQELAQEGGAESARVFGIGTDLEANLVGRFYAFRNTVLRKCSKRGSKRWQIGAATAATAATVLF